ncbi:aryl-alcohol dehydrogenase [Sphingobium faniae]|nr:aryl-alcohol dehydrogenase [Sphingobium faniae]
MKIRAAVTRQPGAEFAIEEVSLDDPRDDEILVRIEAVGICHTDLIFRETVGQFGRPAVLGHEGAGIVEKVGANVTKVRPGDKVLLTFRSCGECSRCAMDKPAYCENLALLNFSGMRPDGSTAIASDGMSIASNFFGQSSFASHVLAYERNVVKIDAALPSAVYAPLGCGVQTGAGAVLRSLQCRPGASIVVIGGGAVGLSAVMATALLDCDPIILIEPRPERRKLALEIGATIALDPFGEPVGERIKDVAQAGVDYVFDSSGVISAIEGAMEWLATDGSIGLVAAPMDPAASLAVPLFSAVTRGISVKGIVEGDSDPDVLIPELIAHHRAGRFPFDRLISTYPFDQINHAVEDQHSGRCLKAVLTFGD